MSALPNDRTLLPAIDVEDPAVETARAEHYGLAARLLLRPPSQALLDAVASVQADAVGEGSSEHASALQQAWLSLSEAARMQDEAAVRDEFNALFVAAAEPALDPHASVYLSGHLMDASLARLRAHLGRLGLVRPPDVTTLEDHLGCLLETLRLLILQQSALDVQHEFLRTHVETWVTRFLADLDAAPAARFYREVGGFIGAWLDTEAQAFAISQAQAWDARAPNEAPT